MAGVTARDLIPLGLIVALLVGCSAPTAQPGGAAAASVAPAKPATAVQAQAATPAPSVASTGAPASAPLAAPQALTKVVQALPVDSFGFLPLYVAREEGFFREEGLELESPVMGSNTALAGLVSGSVDFASAGSGVRAAMQGAPVKAIMYYYNTTLFELVVAPEVQSIEDLRGKALGTSSRGSTEEVTAGVLLRQTGLDPAQDVTFVVVPANSQLQSLLAGSIQGMMINPDLSAVAGQNGLRVLKTVQEVGRAMPAPFSGFVAAQESMQKNPQMVTAWLRANVKGIRFVRENPQAAATIIARVLGVDPRIAEDALPKIVQAIDANDLGGFTEEGFRLEMASSLNALGGQAQVTRLEDLADLSLLRQAQREVGVPCRTGYQCR
jgi:NitT/TauT family transport system substrate-binding protein